MECRLEESNDADSSSTSSSEYENTNSNIIIEQTEVNNNIESKKYFPEKQENTFNDSLVDKSSYFTTTKTYTLYENYLNIINKKNELINALSFVILVKLKILNLFHFLIERQTLKQRKIALNLTSNSNDLKIKSKLRRRSRKNSMMSNQSIKNINNNNNQQECEKSPVNVENQSTCPCCDPLNLKKKSFFGLFYTYSHQFLNIIFIL
jgi:hypothetical protein